MRIFRQQSENSWASVDEKGLPMYITAEEFTKYVYHYLQMAKVNDVYIEDATQGTVWVLRCQRTPLLARLANALHGSPHNHTNPTRAT